MHVEKPTFHNHNGANDCHDIEQNHALGGKALSLHEQASTVRHEPRFVKQLQASNQKGGYAFPGGLQRRTAGNEGKPATPRRDAEGEQGGEQRPCRPGQQEERPGIEP